MERVDVIQFTSCITMTTLLDTSEWLKELQLQGNIDIPSIACYCQGLHMIFSCNLSKNGVVLIYDDIPPEYLKIVDQLPTIAMNLLRPGRGHMLSSTVTGGTWPEDVTHERVVKEKGVGFEPGEEIPGSIRTTAWAFMGQKVPQNYG